MYLKDINIKYASPWAERQHLTLFLFIFIGADPNIPDKYGQTPLMYAVGCGWCDLVQLLLNHGADVTMKDFRGRTVMHAVAATDDVRLLIL